MTKLLGYIAVVFLFACQTRYFSETYSNTENQKNAKKIVRLDLSNQQLEVLPKDILDYTNLQFINLSNNPKLKLDSAFEVLASFPSLKFVRLDSNNIIDLPSNIKKLIQLTHISLVYNPEFDIEENINKMGEVHNLTTLNFSHCNIQEIPKNISTLKQLRNLRLSHNKINTANSFNHLSGIEKLKFLWLDNNQIKQLPSAIGNLKQVIELYLDDNQLSALPESIEQCENMCILYLGNNQFEEIPEQIMDMKMMYMLVLYNNKIKTIPEKFAHTKAPLAVLVMDKNRLSETEIKTAINYFKGFFLFSTKNQQVN
ncbi:MAG: hypothetical protein COW67_02255 [Flavobacteriales bacterium CG18_big_fil_WC_8_21_14_2_50_32_9]|nr:MAG: hypothetical protein COW67_02255 [Flavobacteriales bacterium CG18_big_fil_WC_8_21_14_2_50_32_9]PJC62070.1 MAG: hypothetical protein CO022_06405 [Flavobacteriales bacterium CG_4_9_14_0_2_um_filter_32_27]